MSDTIAPHSVRDEKAALASMLLDREAMEIGVETLRPEDFYELQNRLVFQAIVSLFASNQGVDMISVSSELHRRNDMQRAGGGEYLVELVNYISTAAHGPFHVEAVKNYSILRSLTEKCTEIIRDCNQHEQAPRDILEKAEKYVFAISERGTTGKLEPLSAIAHDALEGIEAVFKKQANVIGLETGFESLDKITSGLQPGNMVVLAARPGMGKTSFALDIARHVTVKKRVPVAFFSLEMTANELFNRLLSGITGINLYSIRTGLFSPGAWVEISRAAEKLHDAPLYLDCSTANMAASGIRSSSRKLAAQMARAGTPLGLIVVDYLQLLTSSVRRYENRQAEVADISRSLKAMAMDLGIPVLALSQLNRQTEENGRMGRPRLSDLRESGSIEQDSDLVMFIYREALYKAEATDSEKSKTKLIIAKHRNGAAGEIDLYFHKETTRFHEADKIAIREFK